jgi:transketolase C-terminal domain/subunit
LPSTLNLREDVIDRLVRLTTALGAKEVVQPVAGALWLTLRRALTAAQNAFEQIAEGVRIASSHMLYVVLMRGSSAAMNHATHRMIECAIQTALQNVTELYARSGIDNRACVAMLSPILSVEMPRSVS